jgi:hypothetical protein
MSDVIGVPKRDEWEIKEDVRALKRAIAILKDPGRLKEVQDHIKNERQEDKSMDLIVDGKLSEALGFSEESENEKK